MKNHSIGWIVFSLCLPIFARASNSIFKSNTGIFYATPELIENDRGLLCLGYTREECANGEFKVIAAFGSSNGSFFYDIEYSLANYTCRASIGKYYGTEGWATLHLKSGKDCSLRMTP